MLLYELTYASHSLAVVGFTAAQSSVDCKSLLSCPHQLTLFSCSWKSSRKERLSAVGEPTQDSGMIRDKLIYYRCVRNQEFRHACYS